MTRSIPKSFFFLIFACNSALFGQGRVDSDPILHNIWWTTYKIDNATNLTCTIDVDPNQNGLSKIIAYYSKKDSIIKVVELVAIPLGTQMTCSYFIANKPIFISVAKNNYHLLGDKKQLSTAVTSFNNVIDTIHVQSKPSYEVFYQAEYFFYGDNARYVNIMTEKSIRVDDKKDIAEGLELYHHWKGHLVTK